MHTPKHKLEAGKTPKPVSPAVTSRVVEIVVDQAIDMADMVRVVLRNDDFAVSDCDDFKPGSTLDLSLGYEEQGASLSKAFRGEVVGLQADFPRRGPMMVRVTGLTKYHRLMRGKHVRAWENVSYSDIASAIATKECKLKPAVDDTKVKHEYVFQRNQTNLEFLLELADKVGFEVFAGEDGGQEKLFFRKPRNDGSKVRTLKRGESLLSFDAKTSVALKPTAVRVLSYDPDGGGSIEGEAAAVDAGSKMGGTDGAAALSGKIGPAEQVFTERIFRKTEGAKALAVAEMQRQSLGLVRAEATVQGAADLRPGFVVQIEGVGPLFSGAYYIVRVVHSFLPSGFTTRLGLKRSSIGLAPEPPPERPPAEPRPPAPGRGRPGGGAPPAAETPHMIQARLVDDETGAPVGGASYEVLSAAGEVVARGSTDWQGGLRHVVKPGPYKIRVLGAGVRPTVHEIVGVIADTTGRQLAGIAYEILEAGGRVIEKGTTDESGLFRKTVPPGAYRVRVFSDPEKRPLKAQVPIRLSFTTLEEAKEWLGRNRLDVEIDGKPEQCGATADSASRVVVQFRVLPGEHEVVVSSIEEPSDGGGAAPLRIVYVAEKINVERGAGDE